MRQHTQCSFVFQRRGLRTFRAHVFQYPIAPSGYRAAPLKNKGDIRGTNLIIQVEAINALGRLGRIARPAVPALKEALDVPVVAVQEAVVEALEKIAPEVLTNGVPHF